MNEAAPKDEKLKTRKEVFKMLQRKLGAYADIDAKLPEKHKQGKHNTSVALNLLSDYVDDNLPLPPNWADMAITEQTPFFFIKNKDGVIVSNPKEYFFATPTAFVKMLQKFYDLGDVIIAEEKQEQEAAEAAREAKEAADLAAIRSGKWREDHMPEPLVSDQKSQVVAPRRTSVFRAQS
jgi:hypothetical protein